MAYFYLLLLFVAAHAHAVEFKISSAVKGSDKEVLNKTLDSVLQMVPAQFKNNLPKVINVKVQKFKGSSRMPNICEITDEKDPALKFRYGEYRAVDASLTLNSALVEELAKGPNASQKIECQHKSLYNQAVATIIHELTHAYDQKNGKPSQSSSYRDVGGFTKFLVFEARRNKDPMRSMDVYEFKNAAESFAVNMEYFTMDEEYACRKPVMFKYFKKHFGMDPFPGRKCNVNPTVMLATQVGLIPMNIDPARVYRIDYLLASSGTSAVSGFGHAMFRIIVCAPEHVNSITGLKIKATPVGPKCLDDKLFHVIASFRANSQDATLDYMKGIFGGYASLLFMLPFQDVIEQYNNAEMRDLISYPLKFSAQERKDFLERLIDVHWDYRGDYKFVTNNCATEAVQALNPILDEREKVRNGNPLPKLTPKSLLDLLSSYGLMDVKDPEMQKFAATSDNLVKAYNLVYQTNINRKEFSKFIYNSTPDERFKKFTELMQEKLVGKTEQESLTLMKGQLVRIASLSVIEQQVVRSRMDTIKKKLADFASKKENQKKNPELFKILNETKPENSDIGDLQSKGYGIPQENEITLVVDEQSAMEEAQKMFELSQRILVELFPNDIKEMEQTAKYLKEINDAGGLKRREYRKQLENYLLVNIGKLSKTADGKNILEQAVKGDVISFREKLGKELISKTEFSDQRIIKLIEERL